MLCCNPSHIYATAQRTKRNDGATVRHILCGRRSLQLSFCQQWDPLRLHPAALLQCLCTGAFPCLLDVASVTQSTYTSWQQSVAFQNLVAEVPSLAIPEIPALRMNLLEGLGLLKTALPNLTFAQRGRLYDSHGLSLSNALEMVGLDLQASQPRGARPDLWWKGSSIPLVELISMLRVAGMYCPAA